MSFRQTTTVWLLFLALITGCSMTHGDPKNPKKNPHPVKRYEITVTADAPGPWDAVRGYISYEVMNAECTPEDKFLGVHALPSVVGFDIEMMQTDEKTWKGYFYRDFMMDEDYYGLGLCHWDATSAGGAFVVHNETFASPVGLKYGLPRGSQTLYFKKSEYWDRSLTGDSALISSADTPEVIQYPDAFFPITITVKEDLP